MALARALVFGPIGTCGIGVGSMCYSAPYPPHLLGEDSSSDRKPHRHGMEPSRRHRRCCSPSTCRVGCLSCKRCCILSRTLKGPSARGRSLDLCSFGKRSLRRCSQIRSPGWNTIGFLVMLIFSMLVDLMLNGGPYIFMHLFMNSTRSLTSILARSCRGSESIPMTTRG